MILCMRSCRYKVHFRLSELLAGTSVTITFFLYLYTNSLHYQIEMYSNQLEATANELSLHRASLNSLYNDETMINENGMYKNYNLTIYRNLDPASLNNTKNHRKMTLIFNRVPKVGSQSTMELLRALGRKNSFTFRKDRPHKMEEIKLTLREQKRLVKLIDEFDSPSVYVKHMCYINFTVFNYTQPIYINMVRDPVERAISWYYYVRAPWYFVERKQAFPEIPLPSTKWLKKDYETCVLEKDKECQYIEGRERPDFAQQTEFFCGHDPRCTGFNTEFAMQRAKENVEKYYAVVGTLEDFNMTLSVLEYYVPRFFSGAKELYTAQMQKLSKVNKNIYKPPVSEVVKSVVRKNFTRELEFYEFCKQRLYMQYAALKLDL